MCPLIKWNGRVVHSIARVMSKKGHKLSLSIVELLCKSSAFTGSFLTVIIMMPSAVYTLFIQPSTFLFQTNQGDDESSQQSRLTAGNEWLLAQWAPPLQCIFLISESGMPLSSAINSTRCSFSVSADPVQLCLHWQLLTAPPSSLSTADVTGCGSRLASSAHPWIVTVLNAHVKRQCWEAQIPCDCLTKSMPDELDSDPSLVCSVRSIHVGVISSDRIMQQGRSLIHLDESRGLINSYSMRKDSEWEMMQYLRLCEFI